MLLDRLIPSPVRESLIVSYYRYKGQATIPKIDEICKVCAGTGYFSADRRPQDYPVELFDRFYISEKLINQIIHSIKDDDIYQQVKSYPSVHHRYA